MKENPLEKKNFLEKEIEAFMEQLPLMLEEHEGKYVAFNGNNHSGFWNSYESVLQEGYEKFGLAPFLIRKVSRDYEIFGRYGKPINLHYLSA